MTARTHDLFPGTPWRWGTWQIWKSWSPPLAGRTHSPSTTRWGHLRRVPRGDPAVAGVYLGTGRGQVREPWVYSHLPCTYSALPEGCSGGGEAWICPFSPAFSAASSLSFVVYDRGRMWGHRGRGVNLVGVGLKGHRAGFGRLWCLCRSVRESPGKGCTPSLGDGPLPSPGPCSVGAPPSAFRPRPRRQSCRPREEPCWRGHEGVEVGQEAGPSGVSPVSPLV